MTMIKIERALNALHASPVGDAAQDPWDDRQAEEVGRAVLGCFRSGSDAKGVERRAAVGTLPEELLRRVFAYIERNLDSKLKWDELAAAVGLDPFRFARGFKRATGTTPVASPSVVYESWFS
jgi:transcriptional regulator GlxA family with amidase domain